MSIFTEIDSQPTPLGEISLRQRAEPRLDNRLLYEVKLGDEFLMSSLFTEGEEQLAVQALAVLDAPALDIVVGGLGLGYTALAAIQTPSVRSVTVIELFEPVIDWHRRGLVPIGAVLATHPRVTLQQNDFFECATSTEGFGTATDRVHAVLIDIDHAPDHWLDPANAEFYTQPSLQALGRQLHPGGVIALWSNDAPDSAFCALLDSVFASVDAKVIDFPNPYSGELAANTVYLARTPSS